MYPYNCQTGTKGALTLYDSAGNQLDQTEATDELGFGYIYKQL